MASEFISNRSCILKDQHASCFELLSDAEKRELEAHTARVEYRKGDVIAKQGAFSSHLIYLEEGLVKVYLEGKGKDLILKIAPPGQFIGLSSIREGNMTFSYSAATYTDARVRLIDIQVVRKLVRSNADFAAMMVNLLGENAAQVYGRFYCMARKQAHGRVADVLLCLSEHIYRSEQFQLGLSRNDLADLTGLSSESLIRILREFKDEGHIQLSGKHLQINDFTALERISHYS